MLAGHFFLTPMFYLLLTYIPIYMLSSTILLGSTHTATAAEILAKAQIFEEKQKIYFPLHCFSATRRDQNQYPIIGYSSDDHDYF